MPNNGKLGSRGSRLEKGAFTDVVVQFKVHSARCPGGICGSHACVAKVKGSLEDLYACWEKAFSGKPFVKGGSAGSSPIPGKWKANQRARHCRRP